MAGLYGGPWWSYQPISLLLPQRNGHVCAGLRRPNRVLRANMTRTAVLALVILLCNLGARWGLIEFAGSHSPFWDEWEGIGLAVLKPAAEDRLSAGDLFVAHNEHRIVWTRTLSLALYRLNGNEWNPVMEMTAGAVIYSITAAALFLMVAGGRPPRTQVILALFLLVLTVPSFAWENTLWGFQTQYYFVFFFSLAALRVFHAYQESWRGPVFGWALTLMAYLSLSSGLLTLPAMIVFSAWCVVRGYRTRSRWLALAGSCLALIGGLVLMPTVPYHAAIMASGMSDFLTTFLRCLSWPLSTLTLPALLLYTPVFLLGIQCWRKKTKPTDRAYFVLMVALWTMTIVAAIAYGRSNGGSGPASRYIDLLIPGVFVNLVALTELRWDRLRPALRARLKGGYGAFVLVSLVFVFVTDLVPDYGKRQYRARAWETNVSGFLASGNPDVLTQANEVDLPFPMPLVNDYVAYLSDPTLVDMLPAELTGRSHVPLLSATFNHLRSLWWLVFSIGLLLFLAPFAINRTPMKRKVYLKDPLASEKSP